MSNKERKKTLIEALAHFLTDNQAGKSIVLEVERKLIHDWPKGKPMLASEWAKLYGVSGLTGWVSYEDAREQLETLLL